MILISGYNDNSSALKRENIKLAKGRFVIAYKPLLAVILNTRFYAKGRFISPHLKRLHLIKLTEMTLITQKCLSVLTNALTKAI